MTKQNEAVAHNALVAGSETGLHTHAGGSVDLKPFMTTDLVGNQAIGSAAVVTLANVEISNVNYSLSNNEITISAAGIYLVSYALSYDITNTSGGTRGCVDCWIEDDDGGSYAVSPGSYCRVYHREASGGSGLSNSFLLNLVNPNKKIRFIVFRANSTTNIDTKAGRQQVSILKLA